MDDGGGSVVSLEWRLSGAGGFDAVPQPCMLPARAVPLDLIPVGLRHVCAHFKFAPFMIDRVSSWWSRSRGHAMAVRALYIYI
jgi:hypothetical protein